MSSESIMDGKSSSVPNGYTAEPEITVPVVSESADISRSPLGESTCAMPNGQVRSEQSAPWKLR